MSILDRAKKVTELDPWVHFSLFGPPGHGKTILACSSGERTLLLDADGTGASALINHPDLIPLVDAYSIKTQPEAMEFAHELRKGEHEYKCVVIDTASMLQMNDLSNLLKLKFKDWQSSKSGAPRNPYISYKNDYGENTNRMRDVMIQFMDLPMNVVITAHELATQPEPEDQDQTIYIRPALTPKLAGTLQALADLTGYLTCDTKSDGSATRKLRVKPTRRITAKTRIAFPTAELTDPTFQQILTAKMDAVKLAQQVLTQKEKVPA